MFLRIDGRVIGAGRPVYIVAELSGNHRGEFSRAAALVRAAADAGADAVKLQTYTPDTMTLDSDADWFKAPTDSPWAGKTLHELYEEAHTPLEWHDELKGAARDAGVTLFSTPFDETAVDALEDLGVPAYKVASFELTDVPLLGKIGATGKPVLLSTGMASEAEIEEAVAALRDAGCNALALLKCTSAYPAPPDEMNLLGIRFLAHRFGVPVGLSDHSLGHAAAVAGVALGACIIEKHLTLSRAEGGPDAAFSLEPGEFAEMASAVRTAQAALGAPVVGCGTSEEANRRFRRSLFVTADVKAGEPFTRQNVRVIRPGFGLPPKMLDDVLGKRAATDIALGTPLTEELIAP